MHSIRIHQLEGFFYVARSGSYTKAAEAFGYPIGQPAVYQQVRGLQDDLGLTLVRQAGPRRTELTPEGRELYDFIAPFFDGMPKLVERLKDGRAAPLLLASDQFLAMEALPPALIQIRKTHPDYLLRMEELTSSEIISRVQSGLSDAGLIHVQAVPKTLVWTPVGRIGVAILIPTKHPLAKLGRVPTPGEIAEHPLVVYGAAEPRRILTERLFRQYGEKLKIAAEVSFSQTMRAFVREGVGPAFVPFLLSGKDGASGGQLPREAGTVAYDISSRLKGGALPFGLLYRSGTDESVAFRLLDKALKATWGGSVK